MPQSTPVDVPIPSGDDIRGAYARKREMTGFAGTSKGKELFVNIAFRTGDIATVYIDPLHAGYLYRLLEHFLRGQAGTGRLPLKWGADRSTAQYGKHYVPVP
jgi:hypothetical protein